MTASSRSDERAATFSRRSLVVLLSVGLGTFTVGLLLAAFAGDIFGESSAGHDTYSRSLVGYEALRQVLERSGVPVVVARSEASRQARADFPLLLLEPLATDGQKPLAPSPRVRDGEDTLATALSRAATADAAVIVVLPKWRVAASPRAPAWIESMDLVPPATASDVLRMVRGETPADGDEALEASPEGEATSDTDVVVRPEAVGDFGAEALGFSKPVVWLGDRPQLVAAAAGLEPLVASDEGVLVGAWLPNDWPAARTVPDVYVVSDPDLLDNRGLDRGDNARIVMALLRGTLGARGVVVDETLHGHTSAESIIGRVLRFPLVLVALHGVLAIGLLGWSVATRFGSPLPPPPALPPGKRLLIENTAALLRSAGDHGDALRRYLHVTQARVARRFSLPEGTSQDNLRQHLERLNQARGVVFDLDAVERAAATDTLSRKDATRLARRIHAWEAALLGEDTQT